jgi:uracil-DNA glycosylase
MGFVAERRAAGAAVYPPAADVFNAFRYTPFEKVKVVIIGQDPYHGPGQAHGLSFSVPPGIQFPPSLQNIFQEIHSDVAAALPLSGCLIPWAQQGVLLLNSVLSVEQGSPGSHANKGWERFTDKVIQVVSQNRSGVTFLLWGSYAQKKEVNVAHPERHCILRAPHPSPLSAYRGFFGCRHFSKANKFLQDIGQSPINWSLDHVVSDLS